jgi:hypothetical protein
MISQRSKDFFDVIWQDFEIAGYYLKSTSLPELSDRYIRRTYEHDSGSERFMIEWLGMKGQIIITMGDDHNGV